MKLHELTPRGNQKLEKDLEKFRASDTSSPKPKISIDDYDADETDIEIDENRQFSNKLDVGKYFLGVFQDTPPKPGMWNWLSVLYFEQLLNTQGRIGGLQRLFVSDKFYFSYQHVHLLMVPYDVCKFYRHNINEIDFLLRDPVNVNGGLYLEIVERQDIVKNHNFIRVARELFYDEKEQSIKRRSTSGDGIGRLIKLYKQYERGFDMYRMPSEVVIDELLKRHKEFARFLS